MNSVERVKRICKERGLPIYRMESDLKFANGYIGQLRKGVFPADRLAKIAQYLGVSIEYLMDSSVDALVDDTKYELKELEKAWKKASDEEKEDIGALLDLKRESLEGLRFAQTMQQLEKTPTQKDERTESDNNSYSSISDRDIRAAFFNGYGDDLSEDEQDALWSDAKAYMQFKLSQRKHKREGE